MGLVRLKKSFRIVNHPPRPAGDGRTHPAGHARRRQKPPKMANCFTY